MGFRLQGKQIFLTYSQCDLDPNELLLWLLDKVDPIRLRVGQEHHEDGGLHLHCVLKSRKRLNIQSERYFDWQGFHPSIEKVKHWEKTWKYCAKEGNYFDYEGEGESDDEVDPDAFDCESSYLRDSMRAGVPYGYASRLWQISKGQKAPILQTTPRKGSVSAPKLLEDMVPWRTTVVVGETGVGKTTWALQRAQKPCLVASHIDDLKGLNNGIKCIIFDDMDFSHWPRTSQIHLVDGDLPRSINIRYGVAKIPAGIQKIFTANYYPFVQDEAIKRRVDLINL